MPFTLTMPKLSPTMEEGTIVKWHKKVGEFVEAGDLLLEVATDKATVEYEALDEGWLKAILVGENGEAIVNQAIGVFTEEKEESIEGYQPEGISLEKKEVITEEKSQEVSHSSEAPKASGGFMAQPAFEPLPPLEDNSFKFPRESIQERIPASPLAKKLAKEQNIDLTTIKGSGPGHRIVSEDLSRGQSLGPVAFGRREKPKRPAGSYHEEPLSPMRKTIGRRLQESKTFIPHWYVKQTIDAAPLIALRQDLTQWGIKVTYNDFILRAVSLALRKHPQMNTGFNSVNETIVNYETIDISVAVSIDGGLITPIIRHADYKTLGELSVEVRELAKKAREGSLEPHEYQGGSFTISNLGMYGISEFQAIINPPQSAILAVGGIEDTPMVKDGVVVPGKQMNLTLSSDHRIIDGALGAEFMRTLKGYLNHPAGLCVN